MAHNMVLTGHGMANQFKVFNDEHSNLFLWLQVWMTTWNPLPCYDHTYMVWHTYAIAINRLAVCMFLSVITAETSKHNIPEITITPHWPMYCGVSNFSLIFR